MVGPVRETVRRHNVLRVAPDHTSWIHLDKKTKLFLWVLGRKALSGFGINAKLHTFPVVLQAKDEFAIYIDDLDVEDIEHVKKLLTELKKTYGDALKVALLPAYGHTLQHGAKTPKELHEKAIELLKFAHEELGLTVIALAHPVIPSDVPSFAIHFPKSLKTLADN